MIVYLIRQKSSGLFLPEIAGRGYTFSEPSNHRLPRLFRREQDAKIALTYWLTGKWYKAYREEHGIEYQEVPERKREDMEICAFQLVEVKP